MTTFDIASSIPPEVADNGSVQMGAGIKCQLVSCLTHPATEPAVRHAHGIFSAIRHFLFG